MQQFVDIAIEAEVQSADFYQQMAGKATDQSVIDLLAKLEAQEREHERILSAYSAPSDDATTFQFAPELTLTMPVPSHDPDFDEMLDVAIKREHKAAEIYRAASQRTVGAFREMIDGLAGFEEDHEDRLKRLRDQSH